MIARGMVGAFDAFQRGWSCALRWPILRRKSPFEGRLAYLPDGSWRRVEGGELVPATARSGEVAEAIVLPAGIVLSKAVWLPHLGDAEIEGALRIELDELNPFRKEPLYWGWAIERVEERGLSVVMAFASGESVARFIEGLPAGRVAAMPAVWSALDTIVEVRRLDDPNRRSGRQYEQFLPLTIVASLCVFLVVLSSTLLWRMELRAEDATRQLDALRANAAPVLADRAEVTKSIGQYEAIEAYMRRHLDAAQLLEQLSDALPESAWLSRLDVEENKVKIIGHSSDATALMEVLRRRTEFARLAAASPITRDREGYDNFSLEFVFNPDGDDS